MLKKSNTDIRKNKVSTSVSDKDLMEIEYKNKDKYVEKLSSVDAEVLANALRTMLNKNKK